MKYCSIVVVVLKTNHVIVAVRCGTSSTRRQSLPSRRVRYTCVTRALLPRWLSLVIAGDRITDYVVCAFFSRQSRYSKATRALMNARQSFWIMKVHQSPALAIFFKYFPVRYAIVDADRQGVTGPNVCVLLHYITSINY